MIITRANEIQQVDINTITPHPKNPNKHSKEQIERLAKIVKYQGFRSPLIISNRSGLLISGHGRLEVAKKMGMKTLPVIFQDFESDEQEYAALVSENSIALWAELDLEGIRMDVETLQDIDIELLGLKDESFLAPAEEIPDVDYNDEPEKKYILEVQFPNDMELMDVHDDLLSRGYLVKVK